MARRRRNKKPRQEYQPSEEKRPSVERVPSTAHEKVVWSFVLFDNRRWSDSSYEEDPFLDVAECLKNYESMTWAEIESNKKRDHAVLLNQLVNEARIRLRQLKQDDIDRLWRFRFSGEKRIWGIRDGKVFKVLWWDPQHKVCPSQT